MNLTVFSQTDINKEPQVCMPLSRAQRIAQDLLRYDSVRTELNNVYKIIEFKDSQIVKLNSINVIQIEKIDSLKSEIVAHEKKFKTADTRVTELQSENAKLQSSKNNLKNWCIGLGSGLIATIGSLIAVISIK